MITDESKELVRIPFPVVTAAAYAAFKSDKVPLRAGSLVKVTNPSVNELAKTRSAALIAVSSKVTAKLFPDSISCVVTPLPSVVVAVKSAILTFPKVATSTVISCPPVPAPKLAFVMVSSSSTV